MVKLSKMTKIMKQIKGLLFLSAVLLYSMPSFLGANEELVSYKLDDLEIETALSAEPEPEPPIVPAVTKEEAFPRPLREKKQTNPFANRPHEENPPLFTLSGYDHPLTQKYIEQYAAPSGKRWLTTVIKRGEPYFAFIKNEIEQRGMPYELIFLPVIESAYSSTAVSRAGATGMWQFMRNSIGPYDMKVTEWMDERKDFWKSTIGALNKLQNEYKRFNNWELTLAAYNSGMGTVLNGLKKHPGMDYWELCEQKGVFKNETINYIPRLLAVAYVLSNPRRYGFDPLWPEDPQWIRIPVSRPVDLKLVAEHAGLPGNTLKNANSELTYGITPPDPGYHIKAPAVHADLISSVLENKELTLIKYYIHTIRKGDTLSGIASRYGISQSQIHSHNPGLKDKYLKIGQRLVIPAVK